MSYMLAESSDEIAREWQKYKGYTVRPLPSTTAYYARLIQSLSHKNNFLMYGGTPEIRTIFQQLNKQVTLVDRSKKVVCAMGMLTDACSDIASNDELVQLDWLQLAALN